MSFSLQQLFEKVLAKQRRVFVLFIDLTKAYDSVPRELLWGLLLKYGVPSEMVEVVKSLHEGMEARVRVGGKLSDVIEVRNGLRQGCTMSPVLFNLFFTAVMRMWRDECKDIEGFGIGVGYIVDEGRLKVGIKKDTGKEKRTKLTDMQFADDAAAVATTREALELMAKKLIAVCKRWG